MAYVRVSVSVVSDDPETITRSSEALSRAAIGLCLEGVTAIMMWQEEEEEVQDE